MRNHYRIQITAISANNSEQQGLTFEHQNHDDIFNILARARDHKIVQEQNVESFVVGLKLFSEVLIQERKSPLFKEFTPHFKQFMQHLKNTVKT